jgi:hypothetical protein
MEQLSAQADERSAQVMGSRLLVLLAAHQFAAPRFSLAGRTSSLALAASMTRLPFVPPVLACSQPGTAGSESLITDNNGISQVTRSGLPRISANVLCGRVSRPAIRTGQGAITCYMRTAPGLGSGCGSSFALSALACTAKFADVEAVSGVTGRRGATRISGDADPARVSQQVNPVWFRGLPATTGRSAGRP